MIKQDTKQISKTFGKLSNLFFGALILGSLCFSFIISLVNTVLLAFLLIEEIPELSKFLMLVTKFSFESFFFLLAVTICCLFLSYLFSCLEKQSTKKAEENKIERNERIKEITEIISNSIKNGRTRTRESPTKKSR